MTTQAWYMKTKVEQLREYHRKCGGFTVVIKLSEMLWKYKTVFTGDENMDGGFDIIPKRVRVPRTPHTYRLKSARGEYRIWRVTDPWCMPFGIWNLQKIGSIHPRLTNNPLRVYAALYLLNRNGGAFV